MSLAYTAKLAIMVEVDNHHRAALLFNLVALLVTAMLTLFEVYSALTEGLNVVLSVDVTNYAASFIVVIIGTMWLIKGNYVNSRKGRRK